MISALVYTFIFAFISFTSRVSPILGGLFFGVLIGGAYEVGHADYIAYRKLYDSLNLSNSFSIAYYFGHYEPGYMLSMILFKMFGFSYPTSRIIIYSISFYIFLRVLEKVRIKHCFSFLVTLACPLSNKSG